MAWWGQGEQGVSLREVGCYPDLARHSASEGMGGKDSIGHSRHLLDPRLGLTPPSQPIHHDLTFHPGPVGETW